MKLAQAMQPMQLTCRDREITFPRRPLVMGIVNINDDSFSGDGTLDETEGWQLIQRQAESGADIIDVGAESARTNRDAISIEEEIRRLTRIVTAFAGMSQAWKPWDATQVWPPLLSVNTWRPEVVASVLPHGGDILNDIGALPDARNASLCARHGAALLIMHSIGQPKVPHTHVTYDDIWEAQLAFFAEKRAMAVEAGLAEHQLIFDPGIDFAKQCADNLALFRHMERLVALGRPVLVPISRKSVIGHVLHLPDPTDRDAGTIACLTASMRRGAHIFRVHNVRAAAQTVKVLGAVLDV